MQETEVPEDLKRDLVADGEVAPVPRIGDWIWRPWYAKLWWTAIPLYWVPAGLSGFDWFKSIHTSSVGIVLNILLTPIVAFLILAFGYLRLRLTGGEWTELDVDPSDHVADVPGRPHWWLDSLHPQSPLWIGRHRAKR